MDISRFLVSNKNLAGCALGLVGLVLTFTGVAGRYWPLVVLGLYLVGVLVTPNRNVDLGSEIGTGPGELKAAFGRLVKRARREKVPGLVMNRLRKIEVLVDGLLARPTDLAAVPDAWLAVDKAIRTDLPTSFEAYLNLPRWYAGRRMLPDTGRGAEQELVKQLRSIEDGLQNTADRVYGDHARWLVEHGRRLDGEGEQAGP